MENVGFSVAHDGESIAKGIEVFKRVFEGLALHRARTFGIENGVAPAESVERALEGKLGAGAGLKKRKNDARIFLRCVRRAFLEVSGASEQKINIAVGEVVKTDKRP
jgi:hypothetical protein